MRISQKVILLMIIDGEKWHYLAVKRLSALFIEITGIIIHYRK